MVVEQLGNLGPGVPAKAKKKVDLGGKARGKGSGSHEKVKVSNHGSTLVYLSPPHNGFGLYSHNYPSL
jgi:hypothetical protein